LILAAARIGKAVLILGAFCMMLLGAGKKRGTGVYAALAILTVLFAFAAGHAASFIPPLRDAVRVEALGEKNEAAEYCEVKLCGISIDGVDYPLEDPISGQWFWHGDIYMWRPETDERQPAGTTRAITLEIPVGWDRTLHFAQDPHVGLTRITTSSGAVETVDTMTQRTVQLGRSDTVQLILNQMLFLFVFAAALLIPAGAAAGALGFARKSPARARQWWREKWFYVLLAGLSGIAFTLMIHSNRGRDLFLDDLAMIHYVSSTDSIWEAMGMDVGWPPLWIAVMFLWYRVAPYGLSWLFLPAQICTVLGIYVVGLCGKRIYSKRAGLIAAGMSALHPIFYRSGFGMTPAAFALTAYGALFLFGGLLLYQYTGRMQSTVQPPSRRQQCLFVITMAAACYTHYFGFFFCGICFLIDLIRFWKKRGCLRSLAVYPILGLLYLPWIYYILAVKHISAGGYWQPEPTLQSAYGYVKEMTGTKPVFYVILFTIAYMVFLFLKKARREKRKEAALAQWLPLIFPVILFLGVFVYGKYIALGNTFWVSRYFYILIPCFMLLTAHGMELIYNAFTTEGEKTAVKCAASLCALLFLLHGYYESGLMLAPMRRDNFGAQSEFLYSRGAETMGSDVMVLEDFPSDTSQAFDWYFLRRNGTRPGFHTGNVLDAGIKERLLDYDQIVCLTRQHFPQYEELRNLLREHYDLTEENPDIQTEIYIKRK